MARRAAERAANAEGRAAMLGADSAHAGRFAEIAAMHRRAEKTQRTAARLHRAHARRLALWAARDYPDSVPPAFMQAVAGATRWQAAVLTLSDRSGSERLVAASDATARRAHELEMMVAQGPSLEAMHDQVPMVCGELLERRWPRFGPLARSLGVETVAAAPLSLGSNNGGGSLTVLDTRPTGKNPDVSALGELAEALTVIVLRAAGGIGALDVPDMEPFEQEDFQPAMHQAAGVLCEHGGWRIPDAIALIRAHAFAENRSVADVAHEVLRGELRF